MRESLQGTTQCRRVRKKACEHGDFIKPLQRSARQRQAASKPGTASTPTGTMST